MRIFLPLVVGAVQMIEWSLPQSQHPFHHFLDFQQYKKNSFPSTCHAAWSIVMISLCQELVREDEETQA